MSGAGPASHPQPADSPWGPRVLPEVARQLDEWLPAWDRDRLAIALYAAGGHTQDLLQNPAFAGLNLVGIVDRNPDLHGTRLGPCRVSPVAELVRLRPDLVLISTTRAHDAIRQELTTALAGTGIQVLDPYQGIAAHAASFHLAAGCGLVLEACGPERLRLVRPGRPAQVFLLATQHAAYAKDLIEAFDYFFESVRPDRESELEQVVDLSGPGYHVLRASGARLFFPSLPEPEVTTDAYLGFARLRPGDAVLDLGAYAGASTCAFARAVGAQGRVLALEPDAVNRAALTRNLAEQGLAQVQVFQAALWDQDGEAQFQAEGCLGSSLGATLERDSHLVPVPTLTLDSLLAQAGLERLDFLKMDIEGAETRVLAQAMPRLRQLRPRMIIEPHLEAGALNTAQVQGLLQAGGFRTQLLEQGLKDYPLVTAQWPD